MHLFETDRLFVRPLSLNDLPALTAMLSDPDVMKFSVGGVCDEDATRKFIEWCTQCYSQHGVAPWALVEKATGLLVGFCGISPEKVGDTEELNLGYRLAKKYWGQGLATESVKAVLNYAFSEKKPESVIAIIEPEHTASIRVAEKSGFSNFITIRFHNRSVRLYRLRA